MPRHESRTIRILCQVMATTALTVAAPALLLFAGLKRLRGGRLRWRTFAGLNGPFRVPMWVTGDAQRPLWLYALATGAMAVTGPGPELTPKRQPQRDPTPEPAPDNGRPARVRPGLLRPSLLRTAAGIGHQVGPGEDETFFAQATTLSRLALTLRYLFTRLTRPTTAVGGDDSVKRRIEIFGVRIDAMTMGEAIDWIMRRVANNRPARARLVSFVNPDCLNKAYSDRDYNYLLGVSDLVLPDGSGLRIAARMFGVPLRENVNGTDLFPLLCEAAAKTGARLYLLGGQPGVADAAARNMQRRFPDLVVAGTAHGYFGEQDEDDVIRSIRESGADILLVGLGAPRQEAWLARHAAGLGVRIGLGVGGLFDYYAGRVARAPLWMREIGLEWVWRIVQQPGDKWRRYVLGNPAFLLRVLKERRLVKRLEREGGRDAALPEPAELIARLDPPTMVGRLRSRLDRALWRLSVAARPASRRMLDITLASLALIVLSPLLLATAAAIRLESPGSVLFRQQRVGRRGRLFTMVKFRSMYTDAEARLDALKGNNESADGVLFKIRNDCRITRTGKFIRRFSIDELPQLYNILMGDMAVVGPRPALPGEVEQYGVGHRKRLQTRPGLTCLWQVSGRSDLPFAEQIRLDIEYLKRQSFLYDLKIIGRTVPAVLTGKGAY